MRDALKAYLSLAGGLTDVTRQRALAAARALVSQGEATAEQVSALAEDVVAQSRANRDAVTALVKFEVDRALGRVGLASADEVGELAARVRVLETQVRALRLAPVRAPDAATTPAQAARPATTEAPAGKAPAGKAPAGKAPAGKAPAGKAPAGKAPAGKAPAKDSAGTGA